MLMVGCRSDRNLNPSLHTFAQGSYGSLIVMLWLGLCLNYYLVLRMLARCVIIRVHLSYSRRCTSIDPPTDTYQHNTYYLAKYGESNLAISPVCSRERFSFYKFSC